jgi:hypothetical protein
MNKTFDNIIIARSKPNWFIIVFLLIYEIGLTVMSPILISILIQDASSTWLTIGILILVLIVWLWVINFLLWQLRGKIILKFLIDKLIIEEKGKLLNTKKQVAFKDIQNTIIENSKVYILCFAIPFVFNRKDRVDIVIYYHDKHHWKREKRIGQNILLSEANKIKNVINKKLDINIIQY